MQQCIIKKIKVSKTKQKKIFEKQPKIKQTAMLKRAFVFDLKTSGFCLLFFSQNAIVI